MNEHGKSKFVGKADLNYSQQVDRATGDELETSAKFGEFLLRSSLRSLSS